VVGTTDNKRVDRLRRASSKLDYVISPRVYSVLKTFVRGEIDFLVGIGALKAELASRLKVGFYNAGTECGKSHRTMNSAGKKVRGEFEKANVTLAEFQAFLLVLTQHGVTDDFANATSSIYAM
jgi:hypothetical protein